MSNEADNAEAVDIEPMTRDQLFEYATKELKLDIGKSWAKQKIKTAIEEHLGLEPSAPAKVVNEKSALEEALEPFVRRGGKIVELTDDYFHFRVGIKECAGNTRQPIAQIVQQANLLFGPVKTPTEE